jgi:hypothetical protein
MLYRDSVNNTYAIREIVDEHDRIGSYGPFNQALDFYQTRARLLLDYPKSTEIKQDVIDDAAFKLQCVPSILDPTIQTDAFFLGHPDFSVLRSVYSTLTL